VCYDHIISFEFGWLQKWGRPVADPLKVNIYFDKVALKVEKAALTITSMFE